MKTTDDLASVLSSARPEDLEKYVREHREKLIEGSRPFTAFIRSKIKELGIKQQEVFLAADIPEGYGYKLISGEKHTRTRDVILRLCMSAGLCLNDVQQALILYGMSPLYPRMERDAALMIAINNGMRDASVINEFLVEHGLEPLAHLGSKDI